MRTPLASIALPATVMQAQAQAMRHEHTVSGNPYGVRDLAAQVLPGLLTGIQLDDVFLVIHSLDISFSEVDK